MLILGAKGLAKEILEVCLQNKQIKNLAFFDDINEDIVGQLYNKFSILKNLDQVQEHFLKFNHEFTIGFGNPIVRKKIYDKFIELGGIYTSTISPNLNMGSFDINIGDGCNILSGTTFSNSVVLGKGCIVYYNSMVTHDCILGDFVELSPGATILGNVTIGDFCHIGSNATILPNIKIGKNVIVGAGAVVIKDLPDNCVAVGMPARVIKYNKA